MSDGEGFSEQERAAMRQRAAELKATTGVKGAAKRAKEYEACLAAIEALSGADRAIAALPICTTAKASGSPAMATA